MPDVHALLGPSSAHRWLVCTPSARLEESSGAGADDTGSEYAREGTLAHRLGELLLRERWEGAEVAADLEEVRRDPLYSASMGEYIDGYTVFVEERMQEAFTRCADPHIAIEQVVKLDEYIPESFGTADCLILSDGLLDVIDLKYGAGVRVEAEDNTQMLIYALGCYLALEWLYPITTVRMTIFQPRMGNISTAEIPVDQLLTWAEDYLKPRAALAWKGEGEFHPDAHACRWCKIAATCRARAEYQMQLAGEDFKPPAELTTEELAQVLSRLPDMLNWAEKVKAHTLNAALNEGVKFPGFKLVAGKSSRRYGDQNAVAAELRRAGYKAGDIYKPKELLGITAMEKLVGKARFEELVGEYLVKPDGAPALVPESDKRPELNTAAAAAQDFEEE